MKRLFFKTVRSDYSSVWAKGPLRTVYKPGFRYQFPEDIPAHCFIPTDINNLDYEDIYNSRKEKDAGNRVMICYGEVHWQKVPYFTQTDHLPWDLSSKYKVNSSLYLDVQASHDFEVLGELALPSSFCGVRPAELTPILTGQVEIYPEALDKIKVTPTQNKLFYKTVRSDYSSIIAKGKLRRRYTVGKRFKFPKQLPGFVFNEGSTWAGVHSSRYIYVNRAEKRRGNRVMVCYGNLSWQLCRILDIDGKVWNVSQLISNPMACWDAVHRHVSTDFAVIGEIALPRDCSERPREYIFIDAEDVVLPDLVLNDLLEETLEPQESVIVSSPQTKLPKRDARGRFAKV